MSAITSHGQIMPPHRLLGNFGAPSSSLTAMQARLGSIVMALRGHALPLPSSALSEVRLGLA
jgi:hypothetical protein